MPLISVRARTPTRRVIMPQTDTTFLNETHLYPSAPTRGVAPVAPRVPTGHWDPLGSLRRPGGQAQLNATLAAQAHERSALGDLLRWMADHIADDLSVPQLARRAAMSRRNFARRFAEQVGTTPARYVKDLRLERARRQLESTTGSLDEIAAACGLGSAEVLRRLFARRLGVTPGRYRTAFGRR